MTSRVLIALLVVAALVVVALVVAVAVLAVRANNQEEELQGYRQKPEVCLSRECVKLASRLYRYMDTSADPCENFYQYACGRWPQEHPIPTAGLESSVNSVLQESLKLKFRGLLNKRVTLKSAQKAQTLYNSCLNTAAINATGTAPLMGLLDRLGKWPVLGKWTNTTIDLEKLLAELAVLGVHPVLTWGVQADLKDSSSNLLYLDQPSLGMPSRQFYVEASHATKVAAYRQFITEVAVLLGADAATAKMDAEAIVNYETELAKLSKPEEAKSDLSKLYNKMALNELPAKLASRFDWKRHLRLMTTSLADMELKDTQPVVVTFPSVITQVLDLVARTPVRTVTSQALWRLVQGLIKYLGEKFETVQQAFFKSFLGVSQKQPRWKTCVHIVHGKMYPIVDRLFVDSYFKGESKDIATDMIQDILAETKRALSQVPWMDEATRLVAVEKANAMITKVGYPDYILNDTYLEKGYKEFTPKKDQLFFNMMEIRRVALRENLLSLSEKVDNSMWLQPASEVNAYYGKSQNEIAISAAILQDPYYYKDYPKSINYGGIGMVIGHEIIHGFDSSGRLFDKDGNIKQWWSDEAIKNFKEKTQCIVEKYGNYSVPEVGLNLNGVLTLGENVADNGGIKVAYNAYRKYVEQDRKGKEEPLLPGVPLNHDQLFFLGFAQGWCSTMKPAALQYMILTDEHAPNKYRVIGTASNSPEFSKAFNCSSGSAMNARKKCSVWWSN